MNSVDDTTYACLVDVTISSLKHEQFWVAQMLFPTGCFYGLFDGCSSPTRLLTVLERVQTIDDSDFACRLTKMTMAQTALEWAAVHRYINSDRPSIITQAEEIWEHAAAIETTLRLRFQDDDYGPRNRLRREFAVLLDRVRREKLSKAQRIEKAQALQTEAEYHGDRRMHHVLESLTIEHQVAADREVPQCHVMKEY